MDALQILNKSRELWNNNYPDNHCFSVFVNAVNKYVESKITLKQLTIDRKLFSDLTRDMHKINRGCYNAVCAAIYASYALTNKEHGKITDKDIEDALRYSNNFAMKAGII